MELDKNGQFPHPFEDWNSPEDSMWDHPSHLIHVDPAEDARLKQHTSVLVLDREGVELRRRFEEAKAAGAFVHVDDPISFYEEAS